MSPTEQGSTIVTKHIRLLASITAAGALLAVPAIGQAHHRPSHTQGGQGQSGGDRCVVNKGYVVKGTLVSYTGDDPATPADEGSVTLTVTRANRHARRSGVTTGSSYTVDGSTDSFKARLSGFDTGQTPAAGDKVRVVGKVAVTKRRCAPDASVEDRYGDANVRRVKIVDVD